MGHVFPAMFAVSVRGVLVSLSVYFTSICAPEGSVCGSIMKVASAVVRGVFGTWGSGAVVAGESVSSKFLVPLRLYHAGAACMGSLPVPYTFFSVIFDTVPASMSSPVTKRTAVSACFMVSGSAALLLPGRSVEAATKRSFWSATLAGTVYER
ncbi:hypothetical protein [Phocaeicola abscessus]|uniref:hypothetical protein n=1 Tax=Phocaeicola abscessus TaxID=555313 RepID=UPI0028E84C6F|nr:hypothetical protein [Phocaeicola abscessus]